jgi:hypothetical protein
VDEIDMADDGRELVASAGDDEMDMGDGVGGLGLGILVDEVDRET